MTRRPADLALDALTWLVVAAFVAPVVWLVQRWSVAVARDPAGVWGANWLVERLSVHPYLTGGALLLGLVLFSGLAMLMVVYAAKRLAGRLVGRGRSPVPRDRENSSGSR